MDDQSKFLEILQGLQHGCPLENEIILRNSGERFPFDYVGVVPNAVHGVCEIMRREDGRYIPGTDYILVSEIAAIRTG